MKKIIQGLFLFTMALGWSQTQDIAGSLEEFTQAAYSGTLGLRTLETQAQGILDSIGTAQGSVQTEARIQVLLTMGNAALQREDKDTARRWLEKAEAEAMAWNRTPTRGSRAILSEVRSRMLGIKDVGFIIANAGAIQEQAEKVLLEEPGNLRASFVVAYGKLYAPSLFGGDPQRSKKIFEQILGRSDLGKTPKFLGLLGLGEALGKLGDAAGRRRYLESARGIYPRNPALLKLLES